MNGVRGSAGTFQPESRLEKSESHTILRGADRYPQLFDTSNSAFMSPLLVESVRCFAPLHFLHFWWNRWRRLSWLTVPTGPSSTSTSLVSTKALHDAGEYKHLMALADTRACEAEQNRYIPDKVEPGHTVLDASCSYIDEQYDPWTEPA